MSNKLKELLARVPKETYDKVSKQMTCAYYFNGGDCSKGLPGTPCILEGCVAWRLHPDFEKKVSTCRDCTFCKRVEGHPRRFYCQMKVQKYHTGVKCFVRLKDVACEDFIKRDEI